MKAVGAANGFASLSWALPLDDGGAPVESFLVTALPSGKTITVGGAQTTARFGSLRNGVATRFTVTAINAAGSGTPSGTSKTVTPRQAAQLVVKRQPRGRVTYGTGSTIGGALVAAGGVGIPDQRVVLMARFQVSSTWHRIASKLTGDRGGILFHVHLPETAALRLQHANSAVAASDASVRSVTIVKKVRVTRKPSATRLGRTVVIKGRVTPGQRVGTAIRLQRRVNGAWRKVAGGHMTSKARYRISWKPAKTGRYLLRVQKPGDARLASGTSPSWRTHVKSEIASDVAKDILHNKRITLVKSHASGYLGSAKQNMVDTAQGRPAQRSCYNSPCGPVRIKLQLLKAVRDIGTRTSITVSEFAGGSHTSGSAHYSGEAVDITWVGGQHVGWGADYSIVVDRCRALGATQIFSPSHDPYGGHGDHIHCSWRPLKQ
jgi:hypothetical protein